MHTVQQGWIASHAPADSFSEAVLLNFDPEIISEEILIAVHLQTHSCTSEHSMRKKYRSAVYTVNAKQATDASNTIINLQVEFSNPIITKVLAFSQFKLNKAEELNYYYSDPDKPFCKTYINSKLKLLLDRFSKEVKSGKVLFRL